MCKCVLVIFILPLLAIFLLDFRTVPTVWYFGTVPTVWYFGTVPTVWYFGTVPTVWYFLFFILYLSCIYSGFTLSELIKQKMPVDIKKNNVAPVK